MKGQIWDLSLDNWFNQQSCGLVNQGLGDPVSWLWGEPLLQSHQ